MGPAAPEPARRVPRSAAAASVAGRAMSWAVLLGLLAALLLLLLLTRRRTR